MSRRSAWVLVLVGAIAACGGGDGTPAHDAAPPDVQTDYVPLATATWTMPAGTEGYWCARATAPSDLYIHEFRPIAPMGTHHTALTIDLVGGPDGAFPCEASDLGFQILFGSGVGTEPFVLPEGVAYKLLGGQQVLLNLHLYNTGETELAGTSGIEVKLLNPSQVVHEAETLYIGNYDLSIPPGLSTQTASCEMSDDTTVFGVFPHMHQLGRHLRGVAQPATGADVILLDRPYSFEEQLNFHVTPAVSLHAGDLVRVECTYDNPGPNTVTFGDSTDDEMCVLGLYRYPARGGISICFQ